MKPRDVVLASTAAGVALGGLAWYVTNRLSAVDDVEPLRIGETFPELSGTTLTGEALTLPDALAGRTGLLVLADSYAARGQVTAWAHHIMTTYGERPDLAFYQVPLISGVGLVMRGFIDAAMVRGTSPHELGHVLTVYGDLRAVKKRLGIGGIPQAYLFILGRTGRLAWRAEGELSIEKLHDLHDALANQGIEGTGQ